VTDLPADFDIALQGVDTRLKALQPGTTLGDIAYSSATANTSTRLPIGTTGQVLAVSGGVPAWTTTADVTPLTTKGDLFTFSTVDARLGVGTNGQTLVADSTAATGLKWATASSGGMTTLASGSLSGSSLSLTSISGSYKNLRVVLYGATFSGSITSGNATVNSLSDYSYYRINASGGTTASDTGDSVGGFYSFYNTMIAAQVGSIYVLDITEYANTTAYKPMRWTNYHLSGASVPNNYSNTGFAKTLSAVTSVNLSISGGTWTAGTYVLYGIN
jgi:hypothetical protein